MTAQDAPGTAVQPSRRRGTLRVYLGAAPGVGKTYAMLNEGRRAKERGRDVVIGFVETYGRRLTEQAIGELEVVPRKQVVYRDTTFEEMDLDAILARRPERVLVDELAHTNIPGCKNEKRWQDVDDLLEAGIDVITTLNIQHLESINDVVERITGIVQRETIPDEIVRDAEQVEVVDITPEALRRRMAHGNIYAAERVDAALTNYFRSGNLAALRELALLWVADQVDVGLEQYRERHGITEPWETRERVVVAITGAPGTESLIRRAARMAQRAHGDLLGVHIVSDEGLAGPASDQVEKHRKLLEDMGGEYHEAAGADVATALVEFARAENATQLVLGASQRSRWQELVHGSIINRVVRLSRPIDVHVISHDRVEEQPPAGRLRSPRSHVPPRRWLAGWLLAVAGVPVLTVALTRVRDSVGLPTVLLAFLALVVAAAATGGTWPALVAASAAFLAANFYFTPPVHGLTISRGEDVVALVVFLGTAVIVSRFVDIAARRTTEAARTRAQARTLAQLAATIGEADPIPALMEHLRTVFSLDGAAVLRRSADRRWSAVVAAGDRAPATPDAADAVEELAPDTVLALAGPAIPAEDQLVLHAFADQLAAVLEHHRLRGEAARAGALAEANALRTALLQAVSHDLRTPLASIKACASSLKQREVQWSEAETSEFVETIDAEVDRLSTLVGNLLDMSRIQAGALRATLVPTPLEEVIPAAIVGVGAQRSRVDVDVPETLPPVLADAALLERALANVVENAVRFSPEGARVRVEGSLFGDRIALRVIDRGPGIPRANRDLVFQPFQRLGDSQSAGNVGLGLAVAHGFVTAMAGTIEIEDTPGGGTTVVITLPVAR